MSESITENHRDLEKIIKEAQTLRGNAECVIENKLNEVQSRGQHLLENSLHSVQQVGSNALASGRVWAGVTTDYVRNNPWRSVSIAAGVAALLTLLLKNK